MSKFTRKSFQQIHFEHNLKSFPTLRKYPLNRYIDEIFRWKFGLEREIREILRCPDLPHVMKMHFLALLGEVPE